MTTSGPHDADGSHAASPVGEAPLEPEGEGGIRLKVEPSPGDLDGHGADEGATASSANARATRYLQMNGFIGRRVRDFLTQHRLMGASEPNSVQRSGAPVLLACI